MHTPLTRASWLFVGAWSIHTVDHARRGVDATTDAVVWAGTAVAIIAAVSITLVLARHPTAPFVAAVVFGATAVGVSLTHLLPEWGVLSDPILVDSTTDRWSVVAVGLEIAAAAWLFGVAWQVLRANDYSPRIDPIDWNRTGTAVTTSV